MIAHIHIYICVYIYIYIYAHKCIYRYYGFVVYHTSSTSRNGISVVPCQASRAKCKLWLWPWGMPCCPAWSALDVNLLDLLGKKMVG